MTSLPWGAIAVGTLTLIAYAASVVFGDMPSPRAFWYDWRWLRRIRRECRHPAWRTDTHKHFGEVRIFCYECERWLRTPDRNVLTR